MMQTGMISSSSKPEAGRPSQTLSGKKETRRDATHPMPPLFGRVVFGIHDINID